MRIATPSSQWTCTTYSLPVSRRTLKVIDTFRVSRDAAQDGTTIAAEGAVVPHAELLAKHAKLKEQAAAALAPKAAPGDAKAYAFAAVLGKKLKGLFRK
jgi:hypothetical protein